MKKAFIPLFSLLFWGGCQTATPPVAVAPLPEISWSEKLQQEATTLPAAQVSATVGSLIIAYPQESLFATGAVLPLAGGAEVLDPLAALLRAYPQASWDAWVRAATANGADYDLSLAQKRSELLKRYLHQAGVAADRISWQAGRGDGSPLELTLRPLQPLPGSSSRVKE
jgi:outer membrane protein OmpA-like peptidoglycan-associated protein